jgi:hypothetical protein
MGRIVLPFPAPLTGSITTTWTITDVVSVEVVVFIEIVVVVDVDVAAAPVAVAPVIAPIGGTPGDRTAPRKSHPRIIAWICIGIVRIGSRRGAVNN